MAGGSHRPTTCGCSSSQSAVDPPDRPPDDTGQIPTEFRPGQDRRASSRAGGTEAASEDLLLRKVFVWRPGQIDWWASGIQLTGTLYFNVSTGDAVRVDLTAQAAHQHVWRPDVIGSVCFLVASGMAWFEVCHGWMAWSPKSIAWQITALNLVGSVAFGVSAVAAYIVPSTGQIRNVELSNLGTFVGALCFLAGAVLLLPERTAEPPPATPQVHPPAPPDPVSGRRRGPRRRPDTAPHRWDGAHPVNGDGPPKRSWSTVRAA